MKSLQRVKSLQLIESHQRVKGHQPTVIPAKAGIHHEQWTPAFAGVTMVKSKPLSSSPRSRGFTLLELLLALAVFALVGLAASTTLSAMLDGRDNYQIRATELNQTELAFTLLEKDLAQLASHRLRDISGDFLDGPWRFSPLDEEMEWLAHNAWTKEINPEAPSVSRVVWSWKNGSLRRATVAQRNPAERTSDPEILLPIETIEWGFFHNDRWFAYPPVDGAIPEAISVALETGRLGKITRRFLLPDPVSTNSSNTDEEGEP